MVQFRILQHPIKGKSLGISLIFKFQQVHKLLPVKILEQRTKGIIEKQGE